MAAGYAPILQWNNDETGFGPLNSSIRVGDPEKDARSFSQLLRASDFNKQVEAIIQQTLDFYTSPDDEKRSEFLNNIIERQFGVKLSMDMQGKVSVTDVAGLQVQLAAFEQFARKAWEERLGFSWQ